MFKFLLVHVVLVAGFTLAFYIQLPDSDAFDDLLTSPFKVLMMFLGEVEYGDSFKEKSFLCQLTLGFFVFGLSIVLMNVLTGVAVVEVETARSSHWLDLADKCLDLDQMAKGPLRRLFRVSLHSNSIYFLHLRMNYKLRLSSLTLKSWSTSVQMGRWMMTRRRISSRMKRSKRPPKTFVLNRQKI